jgi:hypothetical protein
MAVIVSEIDDWGLEKKITRPGTPHIISGTDLSQPFSLSPSAKQVEPQRLS